MIVQTPKVLAITTDLVSAWAAKQDRKSDAIVHENGRYYTLNAAALDLWLRDKMHLPKQREAR